MMALAEHIVRTEQMTNLKGRHRLEDNMAVNSEQLDWRVWIAIIWHRITVQQQTPVKWNASSDVDSVGRMFWVAELFLRRTYAPWRNTAYWYSGKVVVIYSLDTLFESRRGFRLYSVEVYYSVLVFWTKYWIVPWNRQRPISSKSWSAYHSWASSRIIQ
jgi:hypothetical protein